MIKKSNGEKYLCHVLMCILKAGLHYQSFCDHSRNFASEYFIF